MTTEKQGQEHQGSTMNDEPQSPPTRIQPTKRHVVMYSGGIGSWATAKRVAEKVGTAKMTLLFTDTLSEHPDTYRFLVESAANVFRCAGRLDGTIQLAAGVPREDGEKRRAWLKRLRWQAQQVIPGLIWLADGRTIWDVFRDVRFLGNTRVDPCSRILKRELADKWMEANCDPASTVVYVGIDWSEIHRFERMAERKKPWVYQAPLCEAPFLDKPAMHEWAAQQGIPMQQLYKQGAPHANCCHAQPVALRDGATMRTWRRLARKGRGSGAGIGS